MGQVKSRNRTLNFRRPNFQLFKELVDGIPWKTAVIDKGAEQDWQLFKGIDGGGKLHPTVKWESSGQCWKVRSWRWCRKVRLRHNKTGIKGTETVHSYTIPKMSLELKDYTFLSSPSYPHLGISIPFIRCLAKSFCQTQGPTILHIQTPAIFCFSLNLLSLDFTIFTVFIFVDEYLYFLFLHFQVAAVTCPSMGHLSSCPHNLQIR